MKYARLPLHTREEQEERSGRPGASTGAEKPSGLQQGQREDGLGVTEGPFPSSPLRALMGSWFQPWKSPLLRAKGKETPRPRPQASQVEDGQQQIQLDLPPWKLGLQECTDSRLRSCLPSPPDTQLLAPFHQLSIREASRWAPVDRGLFCSAWTQTPSLPSIPGSGGKQCHPAEGRAGVSCRGYRGCWPQAAPPRSFVFKQETTAAPGRQPRQVLSPGTQQPQAPTCIISPPRRTRGKLQLPLSSLSFPLQHRHKES